MKFPSRNKEKKEETTTNKCYMTLAEFPKPLSIPLEVELEKQKATLGKTDSPFDAFKRAYNVFDLDAEEISYVVQGENLLIRLNCYSKKDTSKFLENQKKRESIEKAFNVHIAST